MAETTINVNGAEIGKISIDPTQIGAEGGPEYPYLSVPVTATLAPVASREGIPLNQPAEKERNYTVVQVSGRIWFQAEPRGTIPIGRFFAGPTMLRTDFGPQSFTIEIELDPFRVRRIEEQRHESPEFQLDTNWLVAGHPEVVRGMSNQHIETLLSASAARLPVRIPHSHWVTLLPKLGYGKVELIEVPLAEQIVPNVLTGSLAELAEARKAMARGIYDDVVRHCRIALEIVADAASDPVLPNGRPPSFRDKIQNFLKQMVNTGLITDERRKSVAEVMQFMWSWSSIPQHPHMPGVFNRADAETVMLITTAMLSYTGRLLEASGIE